MFPNILINTHTHTYVYIYMYITVAPRMLAVVFTTRHHRQWSVGRVSTSAARKSVSVPTR
jgi:hypothetical protein